jgi:excisionase family DNA binding protein
MRNLEEWLAFVEEQSRKAQEQRSKQVANDKAEGPKPDAVNRAETRESDAANEAAKPRVPSAEGRALLSWQTTLPSDAESTTSTLVVEPDEEETEDTPPLPTRAREDESPQPLKPYESKDPRYRSSVAPVRQKNARQIVIETPLKPVPRESVPIKAESAEAIEDSAETELMADADTPATAETRPHSPSLDSQSAESESNQSRSSKRARRITSKAATRVEPKETPEEAQSLWERVPRHVQSLIRTQSDEVAQNSYKIDFRESRGDLIQRLLDPELSLEEAARVLGVCPTTVRRYTNRGLLKHHRTGGNQRRFRLSDVLEFMEKFGEPHAEEEGKDNAVEIEANHASRLPERERAKANALQERPS